MLATRLTLGRLLFAIGGTAVLVAVPVPAISSRLALRNLSGATSAGRIEGGTILTANLIAPWAIFRLSTGIVGLVAGLQPRAGGGR